MKALCSCGFIVEIPCNWNINGRYGANTEKCAIIKIVKEK